MPCDCDLQPLWSALKENLGDGDFLRASLTWINALEEPSRGAEKFTEQDVDALDGDCAQLVPMLDWLLLEHDSLLVFVAHLDIETIREACKGWGTDDTALIRAFATRNKRSLARVNVGYRQKHGEPLQQLIDSELGGSSKNEWYLYLAKFLVVQEEQADAMILDLAMQGGHVDHEALVEFLCGRHPKRVRAAKARWEASHDDSLVDLLADHLSGDMARLALKMLKGKRDTDDPVDEHLARRQAHQLHDGELDYVDTLTSNSAAQNKAVARYFEEAYDTSLKRAIGQEYSGPVKAALLALMLGPADWYASQLKAALGGETTNDRAVCRIVGAHDKDEIKEIARAYDRKYGCTLKSAISSECRGNYKRLAVAWVDLPDQLAQPEKLIERAAMADVPEEPTNEGHGEAFDDEISDEDDSVTERPNPASALFAAKMANWTAKYHKYIDMGKRSKADHYQRLILWYPPMPLGHKVLKGYLEALAEEYKGGQQSDDDWTTIWFETVSDEDFDADGDGESDGTDRAAFKAWMDVTESMIAEKRTTINELKSRWGLNEKKEEEETPKYEEPVIASYTTTNTTVASYATNYPQAIPVARPAMPIAQPVQQQYVRPAAYPGAPPIYGTGVAPPIYGQPMMMQQQPMMYGQQPMMYGGGMYQPQMQRPMMQYGGGVSVSVNISM
jgi:annexin A13